jgi:hypothetical protein
MDLTSAIIGHLVADYLLQFDFIAENKKKNSLNNWKAKISTNFISNLEQPSAYKESSKEISDNMTQVLNNEINMNEKDYNLQMSNYDSSATLETLAEEVIEPYGNNLLAHQMMQQQQQAMPIDLVQQLNLNSPIRSPSNESHHLNNLASNISSRNSSPGGLKQRTDGHLSNITSSFMNSPIANGNDVSVQCNNRQFQQYDEDSQMSSYLNWLEEQQGGISALEGK